MVNGFAKFLQSRPVQGVMHHVPAFRAFDQTRLAKNGQVLRYGRLADLDKTGDCVDAQ
jgi:hypothetical protein